MTGPYTSRGLWIHDGRGRRIALAYTAALAVELLDTLNTADARATSVQVGAAGECLYCRAEQGEQHEPGCPVITGRPANV